MHGQKNIKVLLLVCVFRGNFTMELFILFPDGQVTCLEIIFNSVRHKTIFRVRDRLSDQGSADDNSKMGLKNSM